MRYFLRILKEQKNEIKMNNQTDTGFDLIFVTDKVFNQVTNKLNYLSNKEIDINIAWEFKARRNSFKVYRNAKITDVKDNFNPFINKVQGKVITFSCDCVDYYTDNQSRVGMRVDKTTVEYKDTNILLRALKLSNINFDLNI